MFHSRNNVEDLTVLFPLLHLNVSHSEPNWVLEKKYRLQRNVWITGGVGLVENNWVICPLIASFSHTHTRCMVFNGCEWFYPGATFNMNIVGGSFNSLIKYLFPKISEKFITFCFAKCSICCIYWKVYIVYIEILNITSRYVYLWHWSFLKS